jgi:hypothetical protein
MKKFVFVVLMVLFSLIAYSIEVSGHLTEDTTWSPDNNPYLVVDNIWVDAGITLTILPGTIIKFNDSIYPYGGDFFYGDGYSEAKFLKVSGRILAEGTAQDSIVFSKVSNDPERRWGVIILDYLSADDSIFEHCKIEYTYRMQLLVGGDTYFGSISLSNARVIIRNCYFKNFRRGIHGFYDSSPWIYKNHFFCNDDNLLEGIAISFNDNIGTKPYISYNTIEDCWGMHLWDVNISAYSAVTYNTFMNCNNGIIYESPGIIYKNTFIDGLTAVETNYYDVEVKQNTFNSLGGIQASYNAVISENIFENGVGAISISSLTDECVIINNIINNESNGGISLNSSNAYVINNLILNCDEYGIDTTGGNDALHIITNNIISGAEIGIDLSSYSDIFNNVIYDIEDFSIYCTNQNVTINSGNNCFSAPLQTVNVTYNDLGGNIIDDPMFIDIPNGDYHLSGNSPCIDAGTEDTTPFNLPVFDLDFNERIWDGDNNGIPIIDIGCYEYGSQPAMGGIEGNISQNYISNFLPFTAIDVDGTLAFPDTTGYYELKLLSGTYELTATLEFYEEVVIPNITVVAGEYTQVDFEMFSLVEVEEYEVPVQSSDFGLTNYPNPFNPATKITFNISEACNIELEIFNVKGQKIKTLLNEKLDKGIHNVIWNGKDDSKRSVGSGVYFYNISTPQKTFTKRMLLLK